ncbi:uncharacterized protein, partial [Antedon mediterranea]|uniref:uncharacterized protein n=1 Tax=Antedon mediterranea TaxID=105859 RepID=UPI003AF6B273
HDPVTPTANLKMLMNVLSPVIRDRENRKRFNNLIEAAEKSRDDVLEANDSQGDEENDKNNTCTSRKSKSLGLLCQKFLSRYPDYPEEGQVLAIPLDTVSKDLHVERRRIYDIVNVLESVEMVSRRAKNKYVWHGKANLLSTLTRLQEIGNKESYNARMEKLKKLQMNSDFEIDLKIKKRPLSDTSNISNQKSQTAEEKVDSRKEKSLGVMSQKFIMLFLVSQDSSLISLDDAARILIGNEDFLIDESSKLKTKVRRLYDIANILTSLQLIKKVHVTETRGRKPAFKWIGPHPSHININTVTNEKRPLTKHSLLCSSPSPSTDKSRKRTWARHSSFNVMCDVVERERKAFSSAPNTPIKQELNIDESFQADFEKLKKKYPKQVSSLVSKNRQKEKQEQENAIMVALASARIIPKVSGSNGSGPCRALFATPDVCSRPVVKDSEMANVHYDNEEKKIFRRTTKRSVLMVPEKKPVEQDQPVVKKSKTDIVPLQEHGLTEQQLDGLMKKGMVLRMPGVDEVNKIYVTKQHNDVANLKYILQKDVPSSSSQWGTNTKDVDLVCQESISPLVTKSIQNQILKKIDKCMVTSEPQTISCNDGNASPELSTSSTTPITTETSMKPDDIDTTYFQAKQKCDSLSTTQNSSPIFVLPPTSSPKLVSSSQGRYLLSWMAPVTPHCQSTCGTNIPIKNSRLNSLTVAAKKTYLPAATLQKTKSSEIDVKMRNVVSLSSQASVPPTALPLKFRYNPVGLSQSVTTTSQRISPTPLNLNPYRYSNQTLQDASSLLKGLTSLSPIQPSTTPNPYITPPSGSLMQSVVSGLTSFQHKRMPGSVSQTVQRQLTLKTPEAKK